MGRDDVSSGQFFRLFLLRHANAAWPEPGGRDFDRALDRKGQIDIRDVAVRAYAAGYQPERIVASPARRCKETAQAVIDVFGSSTAEYDESLYDEGPDAYIRAIERRAEANSLMIVGHNPMIESLAAQLRRNSRANSPSLSDGGFAGARCPATAAPETGTAEVVDMIAPL